MAEVDQRHISQVVVCRPRRSGALCPCSHTVVVPLRNGWQLDIARKDVSVACQPPGSFTGVMHCVNDCLQAHIHTLHVLQVCTFHRRLRTERSTWHAVMYIISDHVHVIRLEFFHFIPFVQCTCVYTVYTVCCLSQYISSKAPQTTTTFELGICVTRITYCRCVI